MTEALKVKEIKLREPIQFGGSSELISVLHVRKPKAKDIRDLPVEPSTGDILNLAGRLCGQAPSIIDELCIEDCSELLETVGNFIVPGPRTGNKG